MPTTDQLFQEYQNTSIPSFDGDPSNDGQCEQWYLMVRTKRDGLPVVSGNAIDRWNNQEPDHYEYISAGPGVYPKKDDYVVWGAGVGSKFGHVDVCASDGTASGFVGYDSNWNDIPTLRAINHNYAFGILGYIRVKGGDMPTIATDDDIKRVYLACLGRAPSDQEVKDNEGTPLSVLLAGVMSSPERLKYAQTVASALSGDSLSKQAVEDYINKNLK